MPTEFAFRVSMYLTLALSCACLGYAEWDLLPEVTVFMGIVLVLLAVSFKYEGRIELSLARANALGLGIAVVLVAWLAVKVTTPSSGVMSRLDWPTNILPYAGPVLMILIPAKLFRPKHVGDWWAMQGVGLTAVGLAVAMYDDEPLVPLLAAYLFFAVLSLALFYYRRAGGMVAPLPTNTPLPPPVVVYSQSNANPSAPPPYQFAAGRSLRWIGYTLLLAGPLFLLTPRNGSPAWGLTSQRMAVGYNPEPTIEMNRVGDLQANREVACEVSVAWVDGRPVDLDEAAPNMYWRGKAYRGYENSRWSAGGAGIGRFVPLPAEPHRGKPADEWVKSGRSPFTVDIRPRRRASIVVLSPVAWVAGADSSIATVSADGPEHPWPLFPDGHPAPTAGSSRDLVRQVAVLPVEPGLGPGFPLPAAPTYDSWHTILTRGTPDGIKRLAERLLRGWIAEGRYGMTPAVLTDDRPGPCRVAPAHYEAVAKAFHQHMTLSGEYTYATKLRRKDTKLDPIEDFLLNVKEGHCEWFASGYILLLRGVGVPCQYATGFRGQEWVADGKYEIYQEAAHAWAEVLVQRTTGDRTTLHWLSIDPTSGGEATQAAARGWWGTLRQKGADFIADYILGYSPEKRRKAIADATAFAADWWPAAVGVVALLVLWRTRRRWWPAKPQPAPHPLVTSATPPWFLNYLTATARLGLVPPTGQTPKEFAEAVAAALRVSPAGAPVAEVPAFVTSKFYRVRYGGTPLTAGEEAEVRAAVDRLLTAVQDLSMLAPAATGASTV